MERCVKCQDQGQLFARALSQVYFHHRKVISILRHNNIPVRNSGLILSGLPVHEATVFDELMDIDNIVSVEGDGIEVEELICQPTASFHSAEDQLSTLLGSLILPGDRWQKQAGKSNDDEHLFVFETSISASGWPVTGKAIKICLEDNSIVYKVEGRNCPALFLPKTFHSNSHLNELLLSFHRLPLCRGIDDPAYSQIKANLVSTGYARDGIWRSNK